MNDVKLYVAIHGIWGAGKSWLAHSLPGPRLVFDLEGQTELIPLNNQYQWNPPEQKFADLGIEDWNDDVTVVVDIPNADASKMLALLTWLEQTPDHPFESIIVDSFTAGHQKIKKSVDSGETDKNGHPMFDQQAWGRLLNESLTLLNRFNNLTRPSAPRRSHVALVMGSNEEIMPYQPLLQGGIRKYMAGYFNLFCFISMKEDADGHATRMLQLRSNNVAVAKCNIHAVNQEWPLGRIENPDFKRILEVVSESTK